MDDLQRVLFAILAFWVAVLVGFSAFAASEHVVRRHATIALVGTTLVWSHFDTAGRISGMRPNRVQLVVQELETTFEFPIEVDGEVELKFPPGVYHVGLRAVAMRTDVSPNLTYMGPIQARRIIEIETPSIEI